MKDESLTRVHHIGSAWITNHTSIRFNRHLEAYNCGFYYNTVLYRFVTMFGFLAVHVGNVSLARTDSSFNKLSRSFQGVCYGVRTNQHLFA